MTAELDQALVEAARRGDTAPILAALDAGLDVDTVTRAGDTLLMLSAYHGHAETVAALIARGADVDRCNERGQSPLAGAVWRTEGEGPVIDVLLAAGADPDAGRPSARETAETYGLTTVLARLTPRAG